MSSLIKLVTDLANTFDRLQLRYAIGGALAANYWGVVRSTQDVDCLVSIPALKYQSLADSLQAIGCRLQDSTGKLADVSAAQLRSEALDRKFIECIRDSIRIELFVPAIPLQNEILTRAKLVPIGDREIPITTAEDMILLKLVFHRAKDLQDIRGILWVQRGKLDTDYLRAWSAKTHDQTVQQELEQLLSEYQSK
jgi:hypothetical protein